MHNAPPLTKQNRREKRTRCMLVLISWIGKIGGKVPRTKEERKKKKGIVML